MTTLKKVALGVVASVALLAMPAQAAVITNGFTFSVADGNHFHSNTGGSFGNPAGKAEVGRFSSEEVRGLSEYNLTGQSSASSAFVTFNVFNLNGLFGQGSFNGTISVEAYAGNNLENLSDFNAATLATLGSFSTVGLVVGNILSFDITSVYNDAISNSINSLGVRLRATPLNGAGALTFDTFRLTTDNQSTNASVPAPGALALLGLGLLGLGAFRRRKAA